MILSCTAWIKILSFDHPIMKLLSFLLVVMILLSGFAKPSEACMKTSAIKTCVMKHEPNKAGCCDKTNKSDKSNKSNHHTSGSFCYYCVLCIAFIIPSKIGIERNFASSSAGYADLVQSKLSGYNPSCWRPPNA